jgi:Flp pilus assembly secretin CpaC
MSLSCLRGRAGLWLMAALCTAPILGLGLAPARAGQPITVPVDSARLIKLPERAATVVIGNPLIADVSIQPGGLGVITGKGYGATNVIVLDKAGAVLNEQTVEVMGPIDPTVVVYRGVTRQTYSCAPDCERRVTLGDTGSDFFDGTVDKDYFVKTLGQTVTRDSQAMGAGGK